ncbi:MAG TPA: hypothetical protein VK821_06695 [Dehalococcoidia bacterium]|nr:hypothetical protein [Dehalococcoidia bacterium]
MQGFFDYCVHPLQPGLVLERPEYRVSAATADHGGMESYAFRIDYDGGSLVLSHHIRREHRRVGPQRRHTGARGAHGRYPPERSRLRLRLGPHRRHPFNPEQAGRTAREAGVRRLIVTHLKPDVDPAETERGCATEFEGGVTVAEDLVQIEW